MNIFVLDENPKKAAKEHCDKHVVKMIVESAQMLSTAHRILDGTPVKKPSKSGKTMQWHYELTDEREDKLYKAVHAKHPCTIWTMQTAANYRWHYDHFTALCDEYTYRYGKVHKTDKDLRAFLVALPRNISDDETLTKFPLAMKSNPECMFDDPVKSYRAFYKTKQERFNMVWSKRETPYWFTN